MAIGLNQVSKGKAPSTSKQKVIKEQSAKPWESFDKLGPQARTVQANEALRKVGKKREQNNVLSFKAPKRKQSTERAIGSEVFGQVNIPCNSAGLFGFLKRLFLY